MKGATCRHRSTTLHSALHHQHHNKHACRRSSFHGRLVRVAFMTEATEMLLVVESHTRPPSSVYTPAFGPLRFLHEQQGNPPFSIRSYRPCPMQSLVVSRHKVVRGILRSRRLLGFCSRAKLDSAAAQNKLVPARMPKQTACKSACWAGIKRRRNARRQSLS